MGYAENDTEFRALATELLEEFGAPSTFKVRSGGSYDRTQGKVTGGSLTSHTSVLATPPLPREEMFRRNDTVVEGELVTIVAAPGLPFTPEHNVSMTHDSREWIVVGIKTYYSGAQAAIHIFGLKSTS